MKEKHLINFATLETAVDQPWALAKAAILAHPLLHTALYRIGQQPEYKTLISF